MASSSPAPSLPRCGPLDSLRRAPRAALVTVFLVGACRSQPPAPPDTPPPPPRQYADGPAGLRDLWMDIVVAAQKDERERVHDLMASMIMSEPDLAALFGDEEGIYLTPRYKPMVATLVNLGAMELVAQVLDHKFDQVEVLPVTSSATSRPADRALLAALRPPTPPVYTVRVERKDGPDGMRLRYDFFVYRRGRWLTGNQIAKYLSVPDGGAPPTGPPALPRPLDKPAPAPAEKPAPAIHAPADKPASAPTAAPP